VTRERDRPFQLDGGEVELLRPQVNLTASAVEVREPRLAQPGIERHLGGVVGDGVVEPIGLLIDQAPVVIGEGVFRVSFGGPGEVRPRRIEPGCVVGIDTVNLRRAVVVGEAALEVHPRVAARSIARDARSIWRW
jgi:hypothetical protein